MTHSKWIGTVVDQFEQPLLRYALSLLGDIEKARDAVQDTFLRLCRQSRRGVEDRLAQWLYTVCRNRALDMMRKGKHMTPLGEQQVENLESPQPLPSRTLEEREAINEIRQALNGLTANQQEVIRLRFEHDLSYREIAAVTGLSVSNVGFLIHTAIQRIRKELTNECANELVAGSGKPVRRVK